MVDIGSPTLPGIVSHGKRNNESAMSSQTAGGTAEDMKKGESNIMVAVRLRPLISREISEGQFNLIKILDDKVVVLQDPQDFAEGNA